VASPGVRASGYLVYDLSAEALGKASAVSASTREPAAIWFNPAGLSYMPDYGASAGAVLIVARSRFDPKGAGADVSSDPSRFVLPTIYGHGRPIEPLQLGVGVYTAFGLGISWPENWIGRAHTISASLQTVAINPTAAYRLTDELSVGAGVDIVRGAVELVTGLPEPVGGQVTVGGGTWGVGANAGILYRPLPERAHLALTYRSRVTLDFDGRADFDPRPDFEPVLPDQRGSATIILPDIITMGTMFRPTRALELTFDINATLWSSTESIVLDFETAPDEELERNNHDALTWRAGVDYATPWEGINVRGGVIFDQNPTPAENLPPSLPDANRIDIAAGVGFRRGVFKADLGYLYVHFLPSESVGGREGPEGTYRSYAHLVGLMLTVQPE
jgi:long-chain fatty acid transport protein